MPSKKKDEEKVPLVLAEPMVNLPSKRDPMVLKKLQLAAKIRDLQADSAKLNIELYKRGMVGPCW